jgi:hypothetical protein
VEDDQPTKVAKRTKIKPTELIWSMLDGTKGKWHGRDVRAISVGRVISWQDAHATVACSFS